jgi:hypothetical protein
MRDPTGGNVLGFGGMSRGKQRLVGFVLAFVFFALLFGYLISVA